MTMQKGEEDKPQVLGTGQMTGCAPPTAMMIAAATLSASITAAIAACGGAHGAVQLALASGLLLLAVGVLFVRSFLAINRGQARMAGTYSAGLLYVPAAIGACVVYAVSDCEMATTATTIVLVTLNTVAVIWGFPI